MNHYHVFYNTSTYEAKRYCVATSKHIAFEYKTEAAAKRKAAELNKRRAERLAK